MVALKVKVLFSLPSRFSFSLLELWTSSRSSSLTLVTNFTRACFFQVVAFVEVSFSTVVSCLFLDEVTGWRSADLLLFSMAVWVHFLMDAASLKHAFSRFPFSFPTVKCFTCFMRSLTTSHDDDRTPPRLRLVEGRIGSCGSCHGGGNLVWCRRQDYDRLTII